MLGKLKAALTKAASLFHTTHDASLVEIEEILLRADVGVKYTEQIMKNVKEQDGDHVEVLKREFIKLISMPKPHLSDEKPHVVMVCGVNGSGKTTTTAKLANLYRNNMRVLLACSDTYRDAASDQLEIWAKRAQVEIVTSHRGQDAAAVAFDALEKARAHEIDMVVVDTAGRLHTRGDLMEELKKIRRVIAKLKSGGPDLTILTIDAHLGQNSIQQARVFHEQVCINSLILTKCDGTAKGGAVIPICNELKIPVLYLGVGEGIDDIVEFDPEIFVEALFA
jgi:fused signal recognition particle receptor